MKITGKNTKYGMEAWFLVPKRRLYSLIPPGITPYSKCGLGTVVIGAWNHADAYIDDKSYGPVLEMWHTIAITHRGTLYGYVRSTFNNSPSYAEPVNNVFKFSKIQADIQWKEINGRQQVEVRRNDRLIIRFRGRGTVIRKGPPFSTPRLCWLVKNAEQYVAEMTISPKRSSLGLTAVEIPKDSPWKDIADVISPCIKFSVFYTDALIRIPVPRQVPLVA